ncbi:hypothetical protein ACFX2I_020215 [Malus domestica]
MREKECRLWLIKALTPMAFSFSLPPLGLLILMGSAFAKVIKGNGVVHSVEPVNTKGRDLPIQEVIIADCGQLLKGADDGVCNFFKDGDVYPDWPADLDTKPENISWWVTTVDANKAIGNEQFKKQDYKMALRKYRKALWYVDICWELEEIDEETSSSLPKTKACRLKLGDLEGALLGTDFALCDWEDNVKALFRQGQVHMQGIAVGRAVDLTRFERYEDLLKKLEEMFNIEGELCRSTKKWQVVYTDDEDDIMMVGDDPCQVPLHADMERGSGP